MFNTESLFKSILVKIKIPFVFFPKPDFWPDPVDWTVDRVCVSLVRSTGPVDRGSGRCTYQCACLPVDRGSRPAYDFCSQVCWVDRGGRPLAHNGQFFELTVDRSGRPIDPLNSNGQILMSCLFLSFGFKKFV